MLEEQVTNGNDIVGVRADQEQVAGVGMSAGLRAEVDERARRRDTPPWPE